jgi:hypothetical protein
MYDLSVDSEKHTYYTNDILSHNTTTSVGYFVWYTLFNPNVSVAILANKKQTANEIMSRYKFMYENLPLWLQQGIKVWNVGDIELESGSKVRASATSKSGVRSNSINILYIDEMAFIPDNIAAEFFASVYPTISSGKTTKIIISSTPKGMNHFYEFWNGAVNKTNGFVPVKVMWHQIPGRDEQWAKEQLNILGPVRYKAEIECKFLGSTETLLETSAMEKLENKSFSTWIYDTKIYEPPQDGHTYILVLDPSEGTSKDYSAISVIDISQLPFKVVATYRNNTTNPLILPNIVASIGKYYNMAYALIELNRGESIAYSLWNELEYENMIFMGVSAGSGHGQVPFGAGRLKYGVTCDRVVKRIGCNTLKGLIENDKLIVNDSDTIHELLNFVEKPNGTFAADYGKHDDTVMALVLFAWLTTTDWFSQLVTDGRENSIRKNIFSSQLQIIAEDLVPVGIFTNRGPEPNKKVITSTEVWDLL